MSIKRATQIVTGVTSHDGQSPTRVMDVTPDQWNAALVDDNGVEFTINAGDVALFKDSGVTTFEYGYLDASAATFAATTYGGRPLMIAQADFDPTNWAPHRATGAKNLGVTIPANSIIIGGLYDVQETFTDGDDDSATIAIKVEGANDIVTATAISAGGNVFDQGLHDTIPVFSAATAVKTTVERDLTVTVGDAALTAGTMTITLFYFPTIVNTA